jgi:mannose-6-phosphate isomerase-like protein (cupin superfamily)
VSDAGYEVMHLDDLDRLPVDDEGLLWRPIRRRFGLTAFGVNGWTAANAGDRVLEEHSEPDGHEELYFVAAGRARFTLGNDEHVVGPGTLVYARPGTRRGAIAEEPGTTVFAVGAKPGEVFEPSVWEEWFEGGALRRLGRAEEARESMLRAIEAHPGSWQLLYNHACFEALDGRTDEAFAALERALELEPERVGRYYPDDEDLVSLHGDPRWERLRVAGQPDTRGP